MILHFLKKFRPFPLILLFFLTSAFADRPDFLTPEYINQALQGDLSNMEATLETLPDTELNRELLARFRARFIEGTDRLDLEGEDPLIRRLGARMQAYWVDVLMNPKDAKALEDNLQRDVLIILEEEGVVIPKGFEENPGKHLSDIFEARGYHAIFGRTPPLLEFMVWKTTDTRVYEVKLTDRVIEVPVHVLKDFVALGWSNFATFGGPSTGGWATDEGLYVVGPKWDLESEAFQVSFLTHEARHYADYVLFPNLEGPDLEYRAKLTEVIYAKEDLYDLLEKFMGHAARVGNAPHPLANWHVVTDLSRELLKTDWPQDPAIWEDIPAEKIQAAAAKLLESHNRRLNQAGGKTSRGVIKAE